MNAAAQRPARQPSWPQAWWRVMEIRIGIIPLPVYLIALGVIAYFVIWGKLPTEINVAVAVLAVGGFTCAELGKRLPGVRQVGGAAILATFIPSALVYYHVLPCSWSAGDRFYEVHQLPVLVHLRHHCRQHSRHGPPGVDRRLCEDLCTARLGLRIAGMVGTAVGTLLGLGARHTLFFLVVPIMAGGVGEGAIPLSVGYSEILHQNQGELFAEVLPVVMLGSLTAILLAGALNMLGKKYPHLTGEGRLQPEGSLPADATAEELRPRIPPWPT